MDRIIRATTLQLVGNLRLDHFSYKVMSAKYRQIITYLLLYISLTREIYYNMLGEAIS